MKKNVVPGQMMDYPLTITSILAHALKHEARKEISTLTPSGALHRYSYKDLYKRVGRLANALTRLGVGPSERVGTFAWNTHEHLELYFAIPCSGAIVHTLNIRLSEEQLIFIINHAQDRIVFVDATLLPLFEKLLPKLTTVERIVVMGSTDVRMLGPLPVVLYEDLLAAESETFAWPAIDEHSAAALCYTSGTTGEPKGVLYSHRSQFLHALTTLPADALGLRSTDVVLTVVPMFHVNAWGLPYAATLAGADLVFPGMHLKAANLAELIQSCHVTLAVGVPTLWVGLAQELQAKSYDTKSLRYLVVGGSAMPQALTETFETKLKIPVLHAWGMTETSPVGTSGACIDMIPGLSDTERFARKAGQGKAVTCVDIRIVDDSGAPVAWDGEATGSLHVRGPAVAASYYGGTGDSTQFTADGWFVTGDVASISAAGLMRITDRSKDLVKSGGEWLSSVDIEGALMAHPSVLEAAVIAMPHPSWQERPLAVIVVRAGHTAPVPQALADLVRQRISKMAVPDRFVFVADIPKTSVGKIDKKKLRAMLAAGQLP